MAKESFEGIDRGWTERLKKVRGKKVPEHILKDFSASVEARLLEKQNEKLVQTRPWRFPAPVWVPVCAVLILASLVVFRLPKTVSSPISDEIAVLMELGVWTEEDQNSVMATPGNGFEELTI